MTPPILYKYRPFSANSLSIIIDKEVYFASPNDFNDPYDCQISLLEAAKAAVQKAENETKKDVKSKLGKITRLNNIFEKMEGDIKTSGIFSLSSLPDDVLMWSHYADDHEGFCIGFRLSEKFRTWYEPEKIIGLHEVNYTETNPFLEYFVDFAREAKLPKWEDFWMPIMLLGLLSKSKKWGYEKEVRVIRGLPGAVPFDATELVEVIFGLHMSDRNKITIRTLLSSTEWSHVKFRAVRRTGHGFELTIVDK